MSLFLPNIPQAGDNLDFSQGELLSNNQGLDTVFGIEHYKFSDATVNKGFHNQVTTPAYVANPPTGLPPATGANPILYSFQASANIGVIQYSRGPSNAVPSPLTRLQSPSTPIVLAPSGTSNILDFTGVTRAMAIATCLDAVTTSTFRQIAYISFSSTGSLKIDNIISPTFLNFLASGNILQVLNTNSSVTASNVFWSLEFLRVE
jgi:hypothetical protein